MSDIYVRPYDSGKKGSNRGLLIAMVLTFLVGGSIWWWSSREVEDSEQPESEVETEIKTEAKPDGGKSPRSKPSKKKKSKKQKTPSSAPVEEKPVSVDINKRFATAQSLIASGKLSEASRFLDDLIASTTDTSLRNSAIRMQGRANMTLFLSSAPSAQKKSYIIQPGDSLDRIARKHKTTVPLLRRLNAIKGTLIYPGARLLVPVSAFIVQVDKSDRTLELMVGGKRLKRYSIGVGQHGKTPTGTFSTVVHQMNPDWTPPSGGIVKFGNPLNVLGTRWMSFGDKARPDLKGFGIHGTSDRTSIGGETSNGCIRMLNEDVEEVFLLIPRGTRVVISE